MAATVPFGKIAINKDLIFMVMLRNIGSAGGLLETRDGVAGAKRHRSAVVGGPKQTQVHVVWRQDTGDNTHKGEHRWLV